MPTNRRRRRRVRSAEFGRGHVIQLATGHDFWRDAFGYGPAQDRAEMRRCWELHRDDALEFVGRTMSRLRPWAWWVFEQGFDAAPSTIVDEAIELVEIEAFTRDDERKLLDRARLSMFVASDVKALADAGITSVAELAAQRSRSEARLIEAARIRATPFPSLDHEVLQ